MDKKKIKLAILAFSSVLAVSMTASAILADISAEFSGASQSVIQMVLTVPAIMGMVFGLISGPLSTRVSKKTMVVFGLVSSLMGGMIALIFGGMSIYILLLSSALIGVGQGISSTMSMSLIADYFKGEESSSLMGLQSAFVNGGSMVILLISGMLAGVKWNYSYLVYLVFLPIIFIVAKNLPREQLREQPMGKESQKGKLNIAVYFVIFIMALYSLFSSVFQANIAVYLSRNGLGDASASGMVNSLMVAIGAVTGVIYGRLKRTFRNFTVPAAIVASSAGLFVLYSAHSLPGVLISAALSGFGMSLLVPTTMFLVSTAVEPSMSATAIAVVNAGSSIGMFISPLLMNSASLMLGDGSEGSRFIISAVGLLILAIVSVICNRLYTGQETPDLSLAAESV